VRSVRTFLHACTLLTLLLASAVRFADAQALYGGIVGNVTDPQSNAVPGVTLTATNLGTSLKVEEVTDATGTFAFRNLPPGTYSLTATLSGFREHQQTSIPVTAGNPVRINISLELGALTEHVEVASQTTLLQTDKTALNTLLTSKEVTDLTLNQY